MENGAKRPKGVLIVSAIVFVLGLTMIGYWAAYIVQGMPLEDVPLASEILTALAAMVAGYGLYRMTKWGYSVALVVAGMWIYSVVGGISLVVAKGLEFSSPIGALSDALMFVLVLIFSLFLVGYLWKHKGLFIR